MRLMFPWLMCLMSLLSACACGAGSNATRVATYGARTYRDPGGWVINLPPGWHLVRFRETKGRVASAGAQISNVRLPCPTVIPGYPMQVNDRLLPARGIGLIIATDTDPRVSPGIVTVPPLPAPEGPAWSERSAHQWGVGSAPAGSAYMETLWFRGNGRLFIADAKVGATANGAALSALTDIIQSLRFDW